MSDTETSSPGPSSTTPAGLLAVARAAARAGAAVLAQRPAQATPITREALGADNKTSDSDWVTDYDRRAEQAVRAVITAYRPHDEITGEEYGHTAPDWPSGFRWAIDPLDGTTNFIRGIPHFCTSVAVEGPDIGSPRDPEGGSHSYPDAGPPGDHDGAPPRVGNGAVRWLAGAVVAPALGRSWYASADGGAFSTVEAGQPGESGEVGTPQRLSGPIRGRSGRLLAIGFSYDPARRSYQLEQLGELLPHFGDVRRIGSAALDLCMVADGTLDAYAEFGIQEHDWAAGALIAEEAGVPVRRPAYPNSGVQPDWCVAGVLDPRA